MELEGLPPFDGLDVPQHQFQGWLIKAIDIINDWYADLEHKKVYHNYEAAEIQKRFYEPIPQSAQAVEELLDIIAEDIFKRSTLNIHPQYYAYITGAGNQIAILAELLRNALNQNNLKWHSAPANTEIEKIVIQWIAEFIGYGKNCGGVLASGGAVANFLSLAVARKIKSPIDIANEGLYNCPPMAVYASSEGHSSLDKGIDMLGIGKKYLRKIPVHKDFTVDCDQLINLIEQDITDGILPICIVGIAGTTNTGSVDPLEKLANIAQKYNCWFHIDAAYGGAAAALPAVSNLFKGIDLGDSLIINPHKWLFVPFESACVLVRNPEHLQRTFSMIPAYLQSGSMNDSRQDLMEYNLQLTKDFKALKIWMTFKAYGALKIKQAIAWDISLAAYLSQRLESSRDFELMAPIPLSIVCFRYKQEGMGDDQLDSLNQRILEAVEKDGRIFFTGTKLFGKTVLRCCFINHRRQKAHVDLSLAVIREIAEKVLTEF